MEVLMASQTGKEREVKQNGDPKMFEDYWLANSDTTSTLILGWQRMSYFANIEDICWFLEPLLAKEIRALHKMVGNAITENYHLVIGTGSSQLFHAALFALSPATRSKLIDVVSAAPFYSSYPLMTEYLHSAVYKWAGDASILNDHDNAYIELVASPNNPDGTIHHAVVNGTGHVIYDLAYYWPHFTPITSPANHDIMLFSVSKSTGHAGSRIGWALVKDSNVAKKMVKFIEINTIGVSKDSQLRATQILRSINQAYTRRGPPPYKLKKTVDEPDETQVDNEAGYLFHYAYNEMESRWRRLRAAIDGSDRFSVQDVKAESCSFFGESTITHPAFAWIRCEKEEDCHAVFKAAGILTRGGIHFGVEPKYVRLSMLDRSANFDIFLSRLANMKFYTKQ